MWIELLKREIDEERVDGGKDWTYLEEVDSTQTLIMIGGFLGE